MTYRNREAAATAGGFGFWTGWFVVVASMVGSGILTNSGPILRSTGSYSALLLLWALGGVMALAGALSLAELASDNPRAGGDYAFVRDAFGHAVGFVYGWAMAVLGFAAPIALVAFTTGSYLLPVLEDAGVTRWVAPGVLADTLGTAIIVVLTGLHCFGHRQSARLQGITTAVKVGAFAVLGWAALVGRGSWVHFTEAKPLADVGWVELGQGLLLVSYAYTGWNAAGYLSAETRGAERNVPRSLVLGVATVTVIYLATNVVYALALSPQAALAMGDAELARFAEIAVRSLLDPTAARIFSLFVLLGVFASLSAYVLTGPRIVYAMAKDGLCPPALAKLNRKSGTPVRATILQGLIALAFLWSGSFENVLNFTSYGLACIGTLVVSPIFVLRRRADYRPRFRVPGYPWTPALFLLANVAMLVAGAFESPRIALGNVLVLAVAVPLYGGWRRAWRSRVRLGRHNLDALGEPQPESAPGTRPH
jgi:APA family basic amino acid/polyamine antiporter